jgi:hypothetical protein
MASSYGIGCGWRKPIGWELRCLAFGKWITAPQNFPHPLLCASKKTYILVDDMWIE